MLGDAPTIPYSTDPSDEPIPPRAFKQSRGAERRSQRTATAPPIWPYPPHPRLTPRVQRESQGSGCATVAGVCLILLAGLLVGVAVGRASASLLPLPGLTNETMSHAAPLLQPAATATPSPVPTDTPVPTATPPDISIPAQGGVALSEDDAATLITQYYNCCGPDQGEYVIAQIDAVQLSPIDTTEIAACAQYEYASASDPSTLQGTDMRTFTLRSLDGMTWYVTATGSADSCSLQDG